MRPFKALLAAAGALLALACLPAPASATIGVPTCPLTSDNNSAAYKLAGILFPLGDGRRAFVANGDQAYLFPGANGTGPILDVWSNDRILRMWSETGTDPYIGGNLANNGQAVGFYGGNQTTPCQFTLPLEAGIYGSIGYDGSGTWVGGTAPSNTSYLTNPIAILQQSGGYDIVQAWSTVMREWSCQYTSFVGVCPSGLENTVYDAPSTWQLQHAFQNYVDQGYKVDQLPSVIAQWDGSLPHLIDQTTYNFTMLNGTGTDFCNADKIAKDPMIARAPYVFNGIYCQVMTAGGSNSGDNVPVVNPPTTIGTSYTPAPLTGAPGTVAVTQSNTQVNMNLGVAPTKAMNGSGCADLTSTATTSTADVCQ